MTNAPGARRAGIAQGLTLLLPCTLTVMGIVVLAPTLPLLQANFADVPNVEFLAPMVLTVPGLCVALFSAPAGWLADIFGRRRMLIFAMVLYAFLGIAPIFLNDLMHILISRVGLGLTEAAILTCSTTLIGDYFHGPARDRWLGFQTAVASISATALFIIGGALGAAYGWRGPFGVYVYSLLLVVAVLALTWEPEAKAEKAADQAAGAKAAFPWLRMLGICAITLLASIFFYLVQVELAFALNAHGVSDSGHIGMISAITGGGIVAGTLVFQRVIGFPIGLLLLIEFALIGIGFVGMSYAPDYQWLVGWVVVNQIGCGMTLPTLLTWAIRGLAFEIRGRGTGLWQSVFSVGQFLGPIAFTLVAARVAGVLPSFQVFGAAALICALCAIPAAIGGRRQPALEQA
jgi:MFS family permease